MQWRSSVNPAVSYFAIVVSVVIFLGIAYYANKILLNFNSFTTAQVQSVQAASR